MTIVHPPSLDRDTNAIEHLDFAPPCQYSGHRAGEAASLAVFFQPLASCGCPQRPFMYFCEACWNRRNRSGWVGCTSKRHRESAMASIVRVERI